MNANGHIEPKIEDATNVSSGLGKSAQEVLGGRFLTRKNATRLLPFILYLTLLAIIYIANTYYAERKIRKMDDMRDDLKELRFEYISTHSALMGQKKQSSLVKFLEKDGIKASTTPPGKIIIED